jgi:ATP-binding cassette subfamily F protein 3
VDYFAQDQYKELAADRRMLDDLESVAPSATTTTLRSLLGSFLFSADEVFKKIGVLSGGERNRYALARMLLQPANFLLLDEPTNHLDIRAKDILLEALSDFSGTIVFVSHDRYFIDRLATRVFEIGDGKVEIYPGNYEDYLWRKQYPVAGSQSSESPQFSALSSQLGQNSKGQMQGRDAACCVSKDAATAVSSRNGDRSTDSIDAEPKPAETKSRRLNPIKRKQMEDRLHEIEEEITRAEAAIALCETQLQSFVSAEETQRQTQALANHKSDLQSLMKEWEELSEALA